MDSNNPKPNQNCPATNSITDVINSASALTAPKTTIITSILFSFAIKNRRVLAGFADFFWRRHPDLNWGVRVLQTLALPLGYDALFRKPIKK